VTLVFELCVHGGRGSWDPYSSDYIFDRAERDLTVKKPQVRLGPTRGTHREALRARNGRAKEIAPGARTHLDARSREYPLDLNPDFTSLFAGRAVSALPHFIAVLILVQVH
jgi:hypothetical protein